MSKFPPGKCKRLVPHFLQCHLLLWDTKGPCLTGLDETLGSFITHPCCFSSFSVSFLPGTSPEKGAAPGLLCIALNTSPPWYWCCVITSMWDQGCRLWESTVRQLCGVEVRHVHWLHESTGNVSLWRLTLSPLPVHISHTDIMNGGRAAELSVTDLWARNGTTLVSSRQFHCQGSGKWGQKQPKRPIS